MLWLLKDGTTSKRSQSSEHFVCGGKRRLKHQGQRILLACSLARCFFLEEGEGAIVPMKSEGQLRLLDRG